jgi:hypothetical protein
MRFYFDIRDGKDLARDDIGIDLHNVHAARVQATIALTEMAREYLPSDGNHRNLSIDVRGAEGSLFNVSLEYALEFHNKRAEEAERLMGKVSGARLVRACTPRLSAAHGVVRAGTCSGVGPQTGLDDGIDNLIAIKGRTCRIFGFRWHIGHQFERRRRQFSGQVVSVHPPLKAICQDMPCHSPDQSRGTTAVPRLSFPRTTAPVEGDARTLSASAFT